MAAHPNQPASNCRRQQPQSSYGPCRVETEWPDTNGGLIYEERVQGPGGCATLLQHYASRHASSASVADWRTSIEQGHVTVNGRVEVDPDAPVPRNALLAYHRPGWREPPAPSFLDVLWWDSHVVAVHKPSGLQVLPAGPFHERCALTLLRRFHERHAEELQGMPAPVHRLGRGTSGVLICACSEAARSRLSRDFVEHGGANSGCMRKVYRALVSGLVAADEAAVDVPIGKIDYPGVRGGLFAARPDGAPGTKPSRSHYKVVHRDAAAGTTLVDVEIFTGRPHQIRIHMAAAGHPLVGDPLYAPGGLPWPAGHEQGPPGSGAQASTAEGAMLAAAAAAQAAADPPAATASSKPGELVLEATECTGVKECSSKGGDAAGAQRTVMPGDCGYLLHSMVLEFNHPITGERVVATCEPPPPLRPPA